MPMNGPDPKSAEVQPMWKPDKDTIANAELARYLTWLQARGHAVSDYWSAWRWSVQNPGEFWTSIWDYFELLGTRSGGPAMVGDEMPDVRWFPGSLVNFGAHLLRGKKARTAVIAADESGEDRRLTYGELAERVGAVQEGLRALGVKRGDVVVALMPNVIETLVAFIACAGLGAVWSSCSPEFGLQAVLDRFEQLQPKVLLAVATYTYNGKTYDKRADLARLQGAIRSLQHTVVLGEETWELLESGRGDPTFAPLPFEHPLWVLYSSGTTGLPKGIVHSHGGILLEALKQTRLHMDLNADDTFFWYTTTGWMMWNVAVSGLLSGGTIVLYDGSVAFPDLGALWRLAERTQVTYMGVSAGFVQASLKQERRPRDEVDLSALRILGCTGSPLTPEGYDWIEAAVSSSIPIASMSGGTDVCTSFLSSTVILPVYRGELQCPALGVKAVAYDAAGNEVVNEVGELVITGPMPSMPIALWNDVDGSRYHDTYFSTYPGVWRHGDWVSFNDRGGATIYGRSDATLNRGGVRMGSSEFYRVVEAMPEVKDALVVEVGDNPTTSRLLLFVVPANGTLDDDLAMRIKTEVRRSLSPRHVPDEIVGAPAIPRTLNGKKLEVPVKRILMGQDLDAAVGRRSVADPKDLDFFVRYFVETQQHK